MHCWSVDYLAVVERIFSLGSLGLCCVATAIVERWSLGEVSLYYKIRQ